jgi:hypothetical protein
MFLLLKVIIINQRLSLHLLTRKSKHIYKRFRGKQQGHVVLH